MEFKLVSFLSGINQITILKIKIKKSWPSSSTVMIGKLWLSKKKLLNEKLFRYYV